jgi:2-C-methyl-D-erythritol 4-phosphate cytidylyltransferase
MTMTGKAIQPIKDTVALVPAAGSGSRLGLGPKAFLKLGGMTFLRRVVMTMADCVERVLVGVPVTHLEQAYAEVDGLAEVHAGGSTRLQSIFKLFEQSRENTVLVHDVSRPFASRDLVRQVIMASIQHGTASAFRPSPLSIGYVEDDFVISMSPRARVQLAQTPQAFQRPIFEQARQYALEEGLEPAATTELAVALGHRVKIVPDEETNMKVTTPLDWEIAQKVIAPGLGWI